MIKSTPFGLCPYLGSALDPKTSFTYPASENKCHVRRGPKNLDLAQQEKYCLCDAHVQCRYYIAPEPAAAPRAAEWHQPAAPRRFSSRLALLALIVVGELLLVGWGLSARGADVSNPFTAMLGLTFPASPAPTALAPVESSQATPTASASPSATPTQTATATLEPTETPFPSATSTAKPPPPTATKTPPPSTKAVFVPPTATKPLLYPAPVLVDPPDGSIFTRQTTLYWTWSRTLAPDEVFDILVWEVEHPGGAANPQAKSIGNTTNLDLAVDFRNWQFNYVLGKFSWMVRVRRVNGGYLSPGSEPLTFTIIEADKPPTSEPVVPPPPAPTAKPTKIPTPPP